MNRILPLRHPSAPDPTVRLGERLLRQGTLSTDQLQIALHEQRRTEDRLGEICVRLGFLTPSMLALALSEHTGRELIDLHAQNVDASLFSRVPRAVLERCCVLPLSLKNDTLALAVADPLDIGALDEIRRYFPRSTEIVQKVASKEDLASLIEAYAVNHDAVDRIVHELETETPSTPSVGDWEHPIVRLVDTLLADAVRAGASDLHLEPEASFVRIRMRIDGVLHQKHALHSAHWPPLSHRLKVMAGLNIADTRSMQDGRFHKKIGGSPVDFRVAVMPTVQGENIVIRILDHKRALLPLDKLGYSATPLQQLTHLLERPEGIVLVTGPTGSGKTTTLYAILKKLCRTEINIMTLEDPVEYRFELIRQTAINEQQGLGFADGVRGILRQAPDIVFIGEIRDDATAHMALRASMTGHQVFSTLHCNDTFGALPRLNDLGLSSRMLAENIAGIVAQRLVRRLCPHCKKVRAANADENRLLAAQQAPIHAPVMPGFAEAQAVFDGPLTLAEATGCPACNGTGYHGRLAITEVLRITPALDDRIAQEAPKSALRAQARKEGFVSMAADGKNKVLSHDTSLDELRRNVDLTRGL